MSIGDLLLWPSCSLTKLGLAAPEWHRAVVFRTTHPGERSLRAVGDPTVSTPHPPAPRMPVGEHRSQPRTARAAATPGPAHYRGGSLASAALAGSKPLAA